LHETKTVLSEPIYATNMQSCNMRSSFEVSVEFDPQYQHSRYRKDFQPISISLIGTDTDLVYSVYYRVYFFNSHVYSTEGVFILFVCVLYRGCIYFIIVCTLQRVYLFYYCVYSTEGVFNSLLCGFLLYDCIVEHFTVLIIPAMPVTNKLWFDLVLLDISHNIPCLSLTHQQ
jgi:hypothetical protein